MLHRFVLHTTMKSQNMSYLANRDTIIYSCRCEPTHKCRLFLYWWFTIRAVPIDDKWWSVNWLNKSHLNWML